MYYRLTYITSGDRRIIGDTLINGTAPLTIGQTASCDVRLPDSAAYEPMVFATILCAEDGPDMAWYLVRRSDFHDIAVNGSPVGIACYLKSGDIISCAVEGGTDTALKFEPVDDGEYDPAAGVIYRRHHAGRMSRVFAIVSILALLTALCAVFIPKAKDLHHRDLSDLSRSVYHITVDSVYLLRDTVIDGHRISVVVEAIELETASEGTAFLTADSLLVTARHCVEPWINDESWDGVSDQMSPELRLATKAETENRNAGTDIYSLSSHCVISRGSERYDCTSADFFMNKSRDMVLKLGTPGNPVYWRTIFPIARRRDMELGDFAYLPSASLGIHAVSEIVMAGNDDIETLAKSGNHEISVIGYPLNDNGVEYASRTDGMMMEFKEELARHEGCIRISAGINPGNSGGPVFAMIDGQIKAIGIVSKADGRASQSVFWAVPVSEVMDMRHSGDKIVNDSVTFRR